MFGKKRKREDSFSNNEPNQKKRKLNLIKGDILEESMEDYIMHKVNCVSSKSYGGLSKRLFDHYPEADIYKGRVKRGLPGTIEVHPRCGVINILTQYYPGSAKYSNDSLDKRFIWFQRCLSKVSRHFVGETVSIALPHLGSGRYLDEIKEFAKENPNISLVLYSKK